MRLIGATTVRNGADIIEAFVRHNLTVLDALAIVDHGSYDGTSEILAALVREGLPVFVARDDTPAFDQVEMVNRFVRHVFATSDASWIFPLDVDEFLKAASRKTLEDTLRAVPPNSHLLLQWFTYVPRFDAGGDVLTLLRSAKRLAQERHGLRKIVVGRHFQAAPGDQIARGMHSIQRASPSPKGKLDVSCPAEVAALAHVPIRSAPQFIGKMAVGWLATLAAGNIQGAEAFHWREAYSYLRSGRPLTPAQLTAFTLNYGVAQDRWLPADAIALVDDPFLADIELMHGHFGIQDPLALVLTFAERVLAKEPKP
jgi:hypothetical protein